MSVKVKQALIKCFEHIENDTFDEETVRTILIVSREYIKDEGLIKELAHFIAHPVRNKGMFHKKLNSRYAKLKLVEDQISKFDRTKFQKIIKTEEDLSNFMLGGISVEKIESKLFNILYADGLDDLPENHLIKYTGFTKNQIRSFFADTYIKKDGYYYLKTNYTENLIKAVRALPNSSYNPEDEPGIVTQLQQGEDLIKKIKSRVDDIQKVIRGAIYFNSVFDTDTLHREIEHAIAQIIEQFNIEPRYLKLIKDRMDEILLCIMTLLHDSKFVFYDKNEARAYLCFYRKHDFEVSKGANFNDREALYGSGVIALYITYKAGAKKTSVPLFVSELPIKKYLRCDIFMENSAESYDSEIQWISASRIGNELQLTDV